MIKQPPLSRYLSQAELVSTVEYLAFTIPVSKLNTDKKETDIIN